MMKRGLILCCILSIFLFSFINNVSGQTANILPEFEQLLKENNKNLLVDIRANMQDALDNYKIPETTIRNTIKTELNYQLLKHDVSVGASVLLAMVLYSFIKFKLQIRKDTRKLIEGENARS